MHSDEFQNTVISSLADLQAKMNIVVGEDGNGGRVNDLELRTRAVERQQWRKSGLVSALTSGIVSAVIGLWRSH